MIILHNSYSKKSRDFVESLTEEGYNIIDWYKDDEKRDGFLSRYGAPRDFPCLIDEETLAFIYGFNTLEEALQQKTEKIRAKKLSNIRHLRNQKLLEADTEINILEDDGLDASHLRTYRKNLRNITNLYKDQNGKANKNLDKVDLQDFLWPEKSNPIK